MSNTLFALWIGLSAALLLLFIYAALISVRNRQRQAVTLDELMPSFLPVDLEAFTELIHLSAADSSDASARQIRQLRREQSEATLEYLRRMSHNAALLQRIGYHQLLSGNPLITDLAQQMIDAGVHVRLYTFVGLIVLRLCTLFRLAPVEIIANRRMAELRQMMAGSLLPAYEQLKDRAGNLTCLKFVALHEALSQSL